MRTNNKVVLIGAFDTKGPEYAFLARLIGNNGCRLITVNTGVMDDIAQLADDIPVDIPADEVARAGGAGIGDLRDAGDRGNAIKVMSDGAASVVKQLFEREGFDGIIGMGGSAGTNVVTAAMRELPYGIPKICVSTIASANVAPYVGISDITMIPSLTDIAGINSISKMVLRNAAGALTGMLSAQQASVAGQTPDQTPGINPKPAANRAFAGRREAASEKGSLAVTMFGNTTPCVDRCREILDSKGFETLVFHATGAGGRTMEKMAAEGALQGVLDITTTEWADELCGGVFSAGQDRLSAPGAAGIPHLIAPGCIDMCNFGAPDTIPARYKDRLFYQWNPNVTLMRTTAEENRQMGELFAAKANAARGKVGFIIPMQGVSMLDSRNENGEPQLFWDPEANKAFLDGLKSKLNPGIEIQEIDTNINDPVFADQAISMFLNML